MTSELMSLSWVLALQLVMWVPYILNIIAVRGLMDAVGYPDNPKPMAAWAERLQKAHYNAVENLVVFAALVLTAHVAGITTDTTVLACQIYFWARVAHMLLYTFGVPFGRTLAFAVSWVCQIALLLEIL
ncbi:MAG: MAPEG family protein [Gammaproteobacteria bacterium]|nr:MAPEG family protein [Gammaproteobacteria bacterium]